MNTHKNLLVVELISLSILSLLISSYALASESIKLNHLVAANSSAGTFNEVTLSVHIKNTSDIDLKHVKLQPSGKEFCVDETTKPIHIGYLPAQSEQIIQWTAKTPIQVEYFNSGMPVFFHLIARENSDTPIDIPVFSLGGE